MIEPYNEDIRRTIENDPRYRELLDLARSNMKKAGRTTARLEDFLTDEEKAEVEAEMQEHEAKWRKGAVS